MNSASIETITHGCNWRCQRVICFKKCVAKSKSPGFGYIKF